MIKQTLKRINIKFNVQVMRHLRFIKNSKYFERVVWFFNDKPKKKITIIIKMTGKN